MKIRELAQHWEQNAAGTLSRTGHVLHLDLESEARLAALIDMYPKRTAEELLGELVAAALEELEASFPYVQGRQVIAVANDITHQSGAFGPREDALFRIASLSKPVVSVLPSVIAKLPDQKNPLADHMRNSPGLAAYHFGQRHNCSVTPRWAESMPFGIAVEPEEKNNTPGSAGLFEAARASTRA